MTRFQDDVRCPFCNHRKSVKQKADLYFCTKCFRQFDDDPEEGGDYFADPTKRLERQENQRKPRT